MRISGVHHPASRTPRATARSAARAQRGFPGLKQFAVEMTTPICAARRSGVGDERWLTSIRGLSRGHRRCWPRHAWRNCGPVSRGPDRRSRTVEHPSNFAALHPIGATATTGGPPAPDRNLEWKRRSRRTALETLLVRRAGQPPPMKEVVPRQASKPPRHHRSSKNCAQGPTRRASYAYCSLGQPISRARRCESGPSKSAPGSWLRVHRHNIGRCTHNHRRGRHCHGRPRSRRRHRQQQRR